MDEDKIAGAMHFLFENNFKRLKEIKHPIFVKFTGHNNWKKPSRLKKNHFLLLFTSRRYKWLVGYSKIIRVSFNYPFDVKHKYIDRIQMKEQEFQRYINNRKMRILTLLEIGEIFELDEKKPVGIPLTLNGKYLSIEEIRFLLGKSIVDNRLRNME